MFTIIRLISTVYRGIIISETMKTTKQKGQVIVMTLGTKVMTRGIAIKTSASWIFKKFVEDSLQKFMRKDFGDISEEDKQTNEYALENGGMVMGVYGDVDNRIWIMRDTDGNGSFVTTVLFPDEY